MARVKSIPKKQHIHLSYIPRRLLADKEEVKPISSDEQFYATSNTNVPVFKRISSIPSQPILSSIIEDQSIVQNIEDSSNKIETTTVPILTNNETTVSTSTNNETTVSTSTNNETTVSTSTNNETTVSTSTNNETTVLISTDNETSVLKNNGRSSLAHTKQTDHSISDESKQLASKQKIFFKIIICTLVIVGVISAAVLPPVFLLVLRGTNPSSTTTTTSTTLSPCSSTTCIGKETPYHTSIVTVLYPFDGNANDSTGQFAGTSYNSPTYVTQDYVGSRALLLNNPGPNQYIGIPYVDLTIRSFTIETWLYVITSSILNDYGIFSLCDFNSTCLSISLRNGRFALSFDSMNINNNTLISTTYVPIREWIHLTVVYDAILYQQRIYVNGLIDSMSNGMVAPYQRTSLNSTAAIGASKSSAYGWSFFQGRIDQFTISAGTARSDCQIYNDATLTAYFPFNTIDPFNDYSANLFTGIATNITLISGGRIGQAANFTSNTSYFQVQCFPEVRNVSTANPPFTFSLWVNPATFTNGGSIIHVSSLSYGNGSICYDLLALTSTGALVVQSMGPTSTVLGWQGPILPKNTWTHVAIIYSQADGIRLFINGQLSITSLLSSVPYYLIRWDTPLYITLGNNNPLGPSAGISCASGSIPYVSGSYTGAIDDFRLYSRELNNEELCVLANL